MVILLGLCLAVALGTEAMWLLQDGLEAIGIAAGAGGGVTIAITLASLTHTDGQDNTPGLKQKAIFGRLADTDQSQWPSTVVTDPTGAGDLADLAKVTDPIYLLPEKSVYEIYITQDQGEAKGTGEGGNVDSMSGKNDVELFTPLTTAGKGFVRWAQNSHLFGIIPDMNDVEHLYGNEACPLRLTEWEYTTGKGGGDARQIRMLFSYRDKGAAPEWAGSIKQQYSGSGYTSDVTVYYND